MRSGSVVLTIVLIGLAIWLMVYLNPGTQGYSNFTAGLSFQYPKSWELNVVAEDPKTQGDEMVNGQTSKPLTLNLLGPKNERVVVIHSPISSFSGERFDDRTIDTQLNGIRCGVSSSNCRVLENKHKTIYVRNESCDARQNTCSLIISVPTGKYIMSFGLSAPDQTTLDKEAPVLDTIASSVVVL